MDRLLSVLVPAETHDLTTVEIARDELGLTETQVSDEKLGRWITQESAIIAGKLARVLALETLSEALVDDYSTPTAICEPDPIRLTRFPVVDIDSVTINGTLRDPASYEVDRDSGLVFAVTSSGSRTWWSFSRAVIVYRAGFDLPDQVPGALQRAVLSQLNWRWTSAGRDPSIRSEEVTGVGTIEYQVPGGSSGASSPGGAALTPEADCLLDEFRDWKV